MSSLNLNEVPDDTNSNPAWLNNLSPLNVRYLVHDGKILQDEPKRKKVALIGFEEANLRSAPYDDAEWEVWGFNMGNRMGIMHDANGCFRADRWFDLHPEAPQSALDMAWINQCPMPLYLPTVFGTNPYATQYPLNDVEDFFKKEYGIGPYWASSFAYALALAIVEGFTTIGIYGINLNWGRERVVERGNLEFWLGLALGRGIDIKFSPDCRLLTHPARYGIEYYEEKDQVIRDCGELVRQLLSGKEFKAGIDHELQMRHEAIEDAVRYGYNILWRILNQGRNRVENQVVPVVVDQSEPSA